MRAPSRACRYASDAELRPRRLAGSCLPTRPGNDHRDVLRRPTALTLLALTACAKLGVPNDGEACTNPSDCDSELCTLAQVCAGSHCPCTGGDLFDCHSTPTESKDCKK